MHNEPFLIPSILIIVFSLPLCLKLIPRNRFWGVRTKKTLASDDNWYPINQRGGYMLILAALMYLLVGRAYPVGTDSPFDGYRWWLHVITFAGSLAIVLIKIALEVKKLPD